MRICSSHLEGIWRLREAYCLLGKTQRWYWKYKCKEKNYQRRVIHNSKEKPGEVAFFGFVLLAGDGYWIIGRFCCELLGTVWCCWLQGNGQGKEPGVEPANQLPNSVWRFILLWPHRSSLGLNLLARKEVSWRRIIDSGQMSSLRTWPWWLRICGVSQLLNSSSSPSSCSIMAAVFPCRHQQGSRVFSHCAAASWWVFQQYEPWGKKERRIVRRASFLQLNLSGLVGHRFGGKRCFQQTNSRKLTCSDLQWGAGVGVWAASLVGCLVLLLYFYHFLWRLLSAGLLQGPVVVAILTEGIVLG